MVETETAGRTGNRTAGRDIIEAAGGWRDWGGARPTLKCLDNVK
jgi:hypothetical protein